MGLFTRKKKKPKAFAKTGHEDDTPLYFGIDLKSGRAKHNPHQGLVPLAAGEGRRATDLAAAVPQAVPEEVRTALTTIAGRFEQLVGNVHALNRAMHDFKTEIVVPFREELKHLRYSTGDRLNKTSTNLEIYVGKLEKVIWGALRAQGMSDAQIRAFREENGMQPEAPTSDELTAHVARVEAMERTIEDLTRQNRRLIAVSTGHDFGGVSGPWEYAEGCKCVVCSDHARELGGALTEAAGGA